MLKEYKWRGYTWQIDEKDLDKYPGAVPIEKKEPSEKKEQAPKNKSRSAQNK